LRQLNLFKTGTAATAVSATEEANLDFNRQPAKPPLTTKKKSMVPPPILTPPTPSLDIGTWDTKTGSEVNPPSSASASLQHQAPAYCAPIP
jgi:hypothetical protein